MERMTEINRGRSSWRRFALPASIVLNLFLVALIVGHLWHGRRGVANFGGPLVGALARAEAALPPKDAAAFDAVIKRDASHYAEDWQRLKTARRDLRRQVTAEDFDQQRVRQAFATWQTEWNRFFNDFSGTLAEALAQVSPEGRRKLVAERQSESGEAP
jgi:uncharacterized membrane protein